MGRLLILMRGVKGAGARQLWRSTTAIEAMPVARRVSQDRTAAVIMGLLLVSDLVIYRMGVLVY